MKKLVLSSAILFSLGSVHAAEAPRWDSVALSLQSIDVDGDSLTGFSLSGSKTLNENFFIVGGLANASGDEDVLGVNVELEYNTTTLGLGYRYGISANTDVFGVVSYEDAEVKASAPGVNEKFSDNGYGLQVGVRSMLTDKIEANASIKHASINDESETSFGVSVAYNVTENFSLGLGYSKSDDVDVFGATATYFF